MGLRVRRSFVELEKEHYAALQQDSKSPTELEDLVVAFRKIQDTKDPDDFNSFFTIGGYHGEPFRGAGWGSGQWWGGYCNHGNLLFPLWHRGYLWRLEKALQDASGNENLALPFWDETDPNLGKHETIPITFGQPNFKKVDGTEIKNPLYSYTFPRGIKDFVGANDESGADYSKPIGYTTVRYPQNGIAPDSKATVAHNKLYGNSAKNWELLTGNVYNWLNHEYIIANDTKVSTGVNKEYRKCLDAPNYMLFSNTTTASQWNQNNPDNLVTPLEQPHNDIHLAVGGFDVPSQHLSHIQGANGDMGENDTAALDPIFFFHHCHIDRMFWLWQLKHKETKELVIPPSMENWPGTNSVDSQGPTPGMPGNIWLNFDTALNPFKKNMAQTGEALTSRDIFDIEGQMGYTYGKGSLMDSVETNGVSAAAPTPGLAAPSDPSTQSATSAVLSVSGINRAQVNGSFVISAVVQNGDGTESVIGHHSILSRRNVQGCANCQSHLNVNAHMHVHGLDPAIHDESSVSVRMHTHEQPMGWEHKGAKKQLHWLN